MSVAVGLLTLPLTSVYVTEASNTGWSVSLSVTVPQRVVVGIAVRLIGGAVGVPLTPTTTKSGAGEV